MSSSDNDFFGRGYRKKMSSSDDDSFWIVKSSLLILLQQSGKKQPSEVASSANHYVAVSSCFRISNGYSIVCLPHSTPTLRFDVSPKHPSIRPLASQEGDDTFEPPVISTDEKKLMTSLNPICEEEAEGEAVMPCGSVSEVQKEVCKVGGGYKLQTRKLRLGLSRI
ncbi:hypothetical protein V8G54_017153 [Vigna mungo]|uniref:Uncharacterized protein n=1 Tax=Vigna mungo TaxID=3915 RepID=A0AAQ3NQF7_VIGMU